MVAKLPKADRAAVAPLVRSRVAAYEKEMRDWDRGRKEHEANERRRVETDAKTSRADQVAKMRDAYDYRPKPAERKQLMLDVDESVNAAVQRITEKGGKVEETIFGDKKVDGGGLKHLVLDIMTSNPSPDAGRATAMLEHLTLGSDNGERTYKPAGRDVLGNVVVVTKDYGPIHLRPETFKQISTIARQRSEALIERQKKAANPEPSKLRKALNSFDEATKRRAGETPYDQATRARRQAPAGVTE
jgi:hypothetical protein